MRAFEEPHRNTADGAAMGLVKPATASEASYCGVFQCSRACVAAVRYNGAVSDRADHIPVLGEQVLQLLCPKPGQVLLDCTVGCAGHGLQLIQHLAGENFRGGRYIGFDLDAANLAAARARLEPIAAAHHVDLLLIHGNFATARDELRQRGIEGVDAVLADLGFASNQMDDPARGFSFASDGPLDMRLDQSQSTTAADLVNRLGTEALADLIYQFGEERLSRRIARKITEKREKSPIKTTVELAAIVYKAYGPRARRSRIHPATRTFMALRIAVNGELEALDRLLEDLPALLNPAGRGAVISFHSLEDRRVKQAMLRYQQNNLGERLTRKPITADAQEIAANPRSRSAKLRGFVMAEDVLP